MKKPTVGIPTKEKRVNRGREFEKEIEETATYYESQGFLLLRKTDPPIVQLMPGVIVRKKNPFVDFVGTWTENGGRALFIEAKSTKVDRLRVDGNDGSGGVDERQMDALREWDQAGAVSCVLWRAPSGLLLVDVSALESVYGRTGKKSATWHDVEGLDYTLSVPDGDWLAALRRVYCG